MRVNDRLPPVVTGPRPAPPAPWATWPAQLYVTVEKTEVSGYAWDDFEATWDGAGFVWDDPAVVTSSHVDATCWVHGLSITIGQPDAEGRMAAGELAMTLDNRAGTWGQYDALGRLVDWLPGRAVDVWAVHAGAPWWLFSGEVTVWAERANGTVEVEASDAFSRLNAHIGAWDPGAFGQTPAARLEAIATLIGYAGARRFDVGDVTLHGLTTERTPLEEMQQVAMSDGGVLAVDADGTLLYRDRTWPGGRPDQTAIPVLSANVCGPAVDAVVWDLELSTDDRVMVNIADLANVATPPLEVHAENVESRALYGPQTLPANRDADQWATTTEGQALADYLVTRRGDAYLRVDSAVLYLHDPNQDLWPVGIDRRLGDVVELVQDVPAAGGGTNRLDLFLAVETIRHDITPDTWTVTVETTRTVSNRVSERWDLSLYAWDDPAPANTWGH